MGKARQFAWDFAVKLAPLGQVAQQQEIDKADQMIEQLGGLIRSPGIIISIVNLIIRIGERGSINQIIGYLK